MKTWLIILTLIAAQTVSADTLKKPQETKTLSNRIMQHFLKEEFVKGLDLAKEHWPLPPVEIDGLANKIKTQWAIVQQRFGKPTGMELVKEEKISNSFIRYYYLHKFEKHAIYWEFVFYKPKNKWVINGIVFKDDLNLLFVPK